MDHYCIMLDTALFRLINQEWHFPWLDPVMSLLSYTPLLWVILAVTLALRIRHCLRGERHERLRQMRQIAAACLLLACTTAMTEAATYATKEVTGRLRPYQSLAGTRHVSGGEWMHRSPFAAPSAKRGKSFISGHASNSMAFAVTAAHLCPWLRPVIYILPASVGYSRIYLGRHYPSDVLFGWLAGWAVATGVCRVFGSRFAPKRAAAPRVKPSMVEA